AYSLADGQPLWAKPASVEGNIRDIVQHPAGIIMLPEAPPEGEPTHSRRVINGVVQTALNVARYEDGTMVAAKPLHMHGNVIDAIESGKPLSQTDYKAARYYLHHTVEGRTLYVFANRDHRLYAVDREAGSFHALGAEIMLQGGEDPTDMEIRPGGIVLIAPQN